jgi:hypothetical protein
MYIGYTERMESKPFPLECSLLSNVKTFAPQKKEMNVAVTMLLNCPMFAVRL